MKRGFQSDIQDPDHFVVTLELVPGREPTGRSVDTVKQIAQDAADDGRISAVSITDNPGGNPSLGPDIIGNDIMTIGMDVVVHLTNRDTNRLGMESRALNLAFMGIENILAITGDYVSEGFGGQGGPVFDLDSVHTQIFLSELTKRLKSTGDSNGFFAGCAVSPFKYTEGESFAQYAKLCRKITAGAKFIITQLGFDAYKFLELRQIQKYMDIRVPTLGSVYFLSPLTARIMNQGTVPGTKVSDELLETVTSEWKDKQEGRKMAIERSAKLGAILKGLGYKGIHLEGISRDFNLVARILDRMEELSPDWQSFLPEFQFGPKNGFYAYDEHPPEGKNALVFGRKKTRLKLREKAHFHFLQTAHNLLFNFDSPLAGLSHGISAKVDQSSFGRVMFHLFEGMMKKPMLGCQNCGDCAIQHVGFICPESGCPKHTRNGACGGSRDGQCEVFSNNQCVWFKAYNRWSRVNKADEMYAGCIPPRIWELNRSSSWLNFHLKRDHQSAETEICLLCRSQYCERSLSKE